MKSAVVALRRIIMAKLHEGRWTSRFEAPFVLFLIGMRINKPWKVHRWGPVAAAMPRMIRELEANPQLGFLGADLWFARTILVVQYWRSLEALEAYAHARDKAHLPAWSAFNRAIGANGDVGIYHETYRIEPGAYENVYVNMPPLLLGRTGALVEARGGLNSARDRMAKRPAQDA
jgi:hypothetical protein